MGKASGATGAIQALSDAFRSFRCCRDKDIESFLAENAFQYLERGWCSVYLILDETEFDMGHIKIMAYFTLSHKALIPKGASKTRVQDAGGFKNADSIHFVLIGQLGKYMEESQGGSVSSVDITASEILGYAFEVIEEASGLIPCRCVLVECSEEEKVQRVYQNCGFKKFQYDGEHHQFYKRV